MENKLLYEGKAKKIYRGEKPGELLVEYKNSLTAFNAQKKGEFEGKGSLNRDIASCLFRYLKEKGVNSHWLEDLGANEMRVTGLKIIPLEVVVRNVLAGSTAKKLGIEEGRELKKPLVEFYYKNDELGDPFLSDDQVLMLSVVNESELQELKSQALLVNKHLLELFQAIGIRLIDFKVEFGYDSRGQILLADEITPDCCRLWDQKTQEKLDKDRFRRDLGRIKESYEEVLTRLRNLKRGNR